MTLYDKFEILNEARKKVFFNLLIFAFIITIAFVLLVLFLDRIIELEIPIEGVIVFPIFLLVTIGSMGQNYNKAKRGEPVKTDKSLISFLIKATPIFAVISIAIMFVFDFPLFFSIVTCYTAIIIYVDLKFQYCLT